MQTDAIQSTSAPTASGTALTSLRQFVAALEAGGRLIQVGRAVSPRFEIAAFIRKSLDQADMAYHEQAVEKAYSAPLNDTISWNNPQSGHSGTVTPIREGRQSSTGNLCREYKQSIFIDGQAQTAVGTACQNADGSWTVQQ